MSKIYDEIPSREQLLVLLEDENDPKSNNYKRVLDYPKIKIVSVLLNIVFFISVYIGLTLLLWFSTNNIYLTIFIPMASGIVYILIRLSSVIIFLVECYQVLAPKKLRMRCRFEPSCSQYMILSVKKYGAYKGLIKGIKRIKKCHYPNGGYDNP